MSITRLNLLNGSKAIGAYSAATLVDLTKCQNLLFISGQVASDEHGTVIAPGDARQQSIVVFQKIEDILGQSGMNFSNIVFTQILVKDMEDFSHVSKVRNEFLSDVKPASIFIQAGALAVEEHLVEVSAIAVL
ncbi:RidA family protein [Rhizobium leguminosarum]|uniref:RidA family protein n=1 Tax=Rhizobium leguminosarum TaxID=384 RepID=UPI001F317075|nr:RidA family protein [Rhizobium leguminosarum]UIJ83177.1 RidA family protein [Rhizobium leguminosarum]